MGGSRAGQAPDVSHPRLVIPDRPRRAFDEPVMAPPGSDELAEPTWMGDEWLVDSEDAVSLLARLVKVRSTVLPRWCRKPRPAEVTDVHSTTRC